MPHLHHFMDKEIDIALLTHGPPAPVLDGVCLKSMCWRPPFSSSRCHEGGGPRHTVLFAKEFIGDFLQVTFLIHSGVVLRRYNH